MSLVQLKCANCGAVIENAETQTQYRCSHCGTLILNIVDAQVKDGVEIVTPEDLSKFFAKNKQSFIINVGDRLEEFDVESKVINAKIAQAEENLSKKIFDCRVLNGCPESLIVLHLKLLHSYKVTNEYELSMQSEKLQGEIYEKFISLCDETTKETYKKIEEQIEKNIASDNEIKNTQKLLDVQLKQDAYIYAKQMVKKYPYKALSYVYLFYTTAETYQEEVDKISGTRNTFDAFYIYYDELEQIRNVMKSCPDYTLICERAIPLVKYKKYYEEKDRVADAIYYAAEAVEDVYKEAFYKPSLVACEIVKTRERKKKEEIKEQTKLAKKQAKLEKKQLKLQVKLAKKQGKK